jgi:hypothetical protein
MRKKKKKKKKKKKVILSWCKEENQSFRTLIRVVQSSFELFESALHINIIVPLLGTAQRSLANPGKKSL